MQLEKSVQHAKCSFHHFPSVEDQNINWVSVPDKSYLDLLWVMHVVDLGIDVFYHGVLPSFAGRSSALLRGTFRGRTDYMIAMYMSFIGVLVIMALMFWGVL
jgi:hypothetical protein